MPVQSQKQPEAPSPTEEEESGTWKKVTPIKSTKRETKPSSTHLSAGKIVLITLLCIMFLFGGMYVRRNTTVFMEERTQEGYLPVEEYVFIDQTTGQPEQNVRTLKFKNHSVAGYQRSDTNYSTSRGMKLGSSWEEFVEAYGDVKLDTVYAFQVDDDGYIDWEKERLYLNEEMTVRQFDEQYVKTGKVNPETDEIDVTFRAYTDGVEIFYSWDERMDHQRERYNQRLTHPLSHWSTGQFTLEFTFMPSTKRYDGGLFSFESRFYGS